MSRYIDADKLKKKLECLDQETFYKDVKWGTFKDKGFKDALQEVFKIVENQPTTDVQEVVRCKDCVYWQSKKVQMNDGTLRDYTPEEINEGCVVDMSKGINLGSRCTRGQLEDDNVITFWCNENDFCSFGAKMDKR